VIASERHRQGLSHRDLVKFRRPSCIISRFVVSWTVGCRNDRYTHIWNRFYVYGVRDEDGLERWREGILGKGYACLQRDRYSWLTDVYGQHSARR
jgi:hypothetical protein